MSIVVYNETENNEIENNEIENNVINNNERDSEDNLIMDLGRILKNPLYEKWNKNVIANLSISYQGLNGEKAKYLSIKLLIDYMNWCKLNNKNYINPKNKMVVANTNLITDLNLENQIRRDLLETVSNSIESYENTRKLYYRIWITGSGFFVIMLLLIGFLKG